MAGMNFIPEESKLYCVEILQADSGISIPLQWKQLVMAAEILSSMTSHPRH